MGITSGVRRKEPLGRIEPKRCLTLKKPANEPAIDPAKNGMANCTVINLPGQGASALKYETLIEERGAVPFRDAACGLCERTVSVALGVPLEMMKVKTRSTADVALARQIAMYLSNTSFNIICTEVGLYFKRDRTTVAHACRLIEDKRELPDFDLMICQLEALLQSAQYVSDLLSLSEIQGLLEERGTYYD